MIDRNFWSIKYYWFLRRGLCAAILLSTAGSGTYGQAKVTAADKALQAADSLSERAQYEAAYHGYERAKQLYAQAQDLTGWYQASRNASIILSTRLKRPFQAQTDLLRALENPLRAPATTAEYDARCKTLMRLGYIAIKSTGDYELAKNVLLKAQKIYDDHLENESSTAMAEFIYLQLGNVFMRLREYAGAEQIYRRGLSLSYKYNAPSIAKYNDFGELYLVQGKDALALKIFREGKRRKGLSAYEQTLLSLSEAECLTKLGSVAEAKAANRAASAMLKKNPPADSSRYWRSYMYLYENYALIYSLNREWGAAVRMYDKAIDAGRNAPADIEPRMVAGHILKKAELWIRLNRPDSVLAATAEALNILLPGHRFGPGVLPAGGQAKPENMLVMALQLQAEAFLLQGNPESALAAFELLPEIEARLRATHDYESSTLLSLRESRRRFDRAVEIAWALFRRSGDVQFAYRAFNLTEHARGLLLLESLARAQSDFKLPAALAARENDLNVQIKWHEREIATARQTANTDYARRLEQKLYDLNRQKDALLERMAQEAPGYAELFREPELLRAEAVFSILPQGGTMLSYYLSADKVYIFRFGPGREISWRAADISEDFRSGVQQLNRYLTNIVETGADQQWFVQKSHELYLLLAGPELDGLAAGTSLIVVPDDVLSFIPFEILLRRAGNAIWPGQAFLLRDFAVSYAYSASLLRLQQQITRSNKPGRRLFAGFAPAYHPEKAARDDQQVAGLMRGGMYNLPGSHEELRKVHRVIGGDAFDDSLATEALFKKIASRYRILLLSMHGLADEENPVLSRMLFGDFKPGGSGDDDNVLYASELQIMQLRADLAVLSACQTGFGKWHKGEGVYSLARAFAAAGVPATVMSLWRLPDGTAPLLIESFFQNLKKGMAKDEALQQAKLHFLDNPANFEFSHPGYWSCVVANGDMSPMPLRSYGWLWWLLILLPVGAAMRWYWQKKSIFAQKNYAAPS